MKNKVWLFTAALLLFTAGCGEPDMAQNKINSNEQKTAGISDTDETESEIDSSRRKIYLERDHAAVPGELGR